MIDDNDDGGGGETPRYQGNPINSRDRMIKICFPELSALKFKLVINYK